MRGRQTGRWMAAAGVISALCAGVGFGAQTAIGNHTHTASLWLHGVEHGNTDDGSVHDHMHSSDGHARTSQLAHGRCNVDHSATESVQTATHNWWDLLYVNAGDEYLNFASTRSTQTSLSHHHHNHWYSC